jgi:uncharacterized membrane protein
MLESLIEIPLLAGIVFVVVGYFFFKNPPKKINSFYGYRTARSKKSQEHWDFAQNYSAKEMMNLGFFLALTSFMGKLIEMDQTTRIAVGLAMMIFTLVVLYIRVEKALRDKFQD